MYVYVYSSTCMLSEFMDIDVSYLLLQYITYSYELV